MAKHPYQFGIALSGGGTRGYAHLGVLQALHEHGIRPDKIAGTSAGAIVAALYANGKTPEEIHELLKARNVFSFTRIRLPRYGLFSLDGLTQLLEDHLTVSRIEELSVPTVITATNLNMGRIEYFNTGPLIKTVVASASIPVVFSPVRIGAYEYCDGGVYDNLPMAAILNDCAIKIGVNISPVEEVPGPLNLIDIAARSFQMGVNANVVKSIEKCNLYIEPEGIRQFGLLSSGNNDAIFQAGYSTTKRLLEDRGEELLSAPSFWERITNWFQ